MGAWSLSFSVTFRNLPCSDSHNHVMLGLTLIFRRGPLNHIHVISALGGGISSPKSSPVTHVHKHISHETCFVWGRRCCTVWCEIPAVYTGSFSSQSKDWIGSIYVSICVVLYLYGELLVLKVDLQVKETVGWCSVQPLAVCKVLTGKLILLTL